MKGSKKIFLDPLDQAPSTKLQGLKIKKSGYIISMVQYLNSSVVVKLRSRSLHCRKEVVYG